MKSKTSKQTIKRALARVSRFVFLTWNAELAVGKVERVGCREGAWQDEIKKLHVQITSLGVTLPRRVGLGA